MSEEVNQGQPSSVLNTDPIEGASETDKIETTSKSSTSGTMASALHSDGTPKYDSLSGPKSGAAHQFGDSKQVVFAELADRPNTRDHAQEGTPSGQIEGASGDFYCSEEQHLSANLSDRTDPDYMGELFDQCKETTISSAAFEQLLKKCIQIGKFDPSYTDDNDGLNILMAAMKAKNPPAMRALFSAGLWSDLRDHKIGNHVQTPGFAGKDVMDFAKTIVKSKKVLTEVKKLDSLEEKLTPLHKAIMKDDEKQVRELIKSLNKTDLSNRDEEGNSPLHYACIMGNINIVMILINASANIKAVNNDEQNSIHLAAKHANKKVLDFLVKKNEINLEERDAIKKTPMLYTAETGHIESTELLLKHGATLDKNILCSAAQNGCLDYILQAINKYNLSLSYVDDRQKSLLHHACVHGHVRLILHLLENMPNIREALMMKDKSGRNVLHVCCDSEVYQAETLKRILEKAKKLNVLKKMLNERDLYSGLGMCVLVSGKDRGKPAYHYVEIKRGTASIFETKVKSGLIDVAQHGRVVKSGWGENPPREVVNEVENSLLERLEPSQNPVKDCTPLHLAVYKDSEELVELLVNHGTDVNIADSFGLTPAHLAAMRGNLKVLKLLENAGARMNIKDCDGREIVDVAKANEHINIAHYVKGKGLFEVSQTFALSVMKRMLLFKKEELERLRAEGQDIHKHLVAALRDLNIDINLALMDIGSSPIMEETT